MKYIVAIAHRGAHEHAPENTLAAYRAAIELGADYVEIDIRRTKDDQYVSVHNGTVDGRTDGTGRVDELTLAELKALDAGRRFSPEFAGERIPTVDETLALLSGRIGAYVDVKDAPPDVVVAFLRSHDMISDSLIYAENDELAAMRVIEPSIQVMPEYPGSIAGLRDLAKEMRPEVLAVSLIENLSEELVDAAHDLGMMVHADVQSEAWDHPDGWAKAIETGLDGMQTDRPSVMIPWLESNGFRSGKRLR